MARKRSDDDSHHSLLALVALISLVAFVGVLTIARLPEGGITGNVVSEAQLKGFDCSACEGKPVCAGVNGKAYTVENACSAVCADLHVIADVPCSRIPEN